MSKCKKLTALFIAALMLLSFAPMCTAAEQEPQIKNVIFMIGDGMGPNHLEWAKAATGESLVMDTMPVQGYRITNSRSGVTDSAAGGTAIKAPMAGTIVKVNVTAGQSVKKGDVVAVLEAMKMENEIFAPVDGVVASVNVSKGAAVKADDLIASLN